MVIDEIWNIRWFNVFILNIESLNEINHFVNGIDKGNMSFFNFIHKLKLK